MVEQKIEQQKVTKLVGQNVDQLVEKKVFSAVSLVEQFVERKAAQQVEKLVEKKVAKLLQNIEQLVQRQVETTG